MKRLLDRLFRRKPPIVERRQVSYADADALLKEGWELDIEQEDFHTPNPLNPTVHLCRRSADA